MSKGRTDLSRALDNLQGFAEDLIAAQTKRRIQLGREKEGRMVEAYSYLIGQENDQISELETSLENIESNLEQRGVELKSIDDQYKTIDSEVLLAAANKGSIELLKVELEDRQNYRDNLQKKKTQASSIKRHIDLFDDAMATIDPKHFGDPDIIEAEDVANIANNFISEHDSLYTPEVQQRIEALQTEASLEGLQADYYARLTRESEEKIAKAQAETTDSKIKMETLEGVKKETLEGVKAMTYQPVSSMTEQFRGIIGLQSELSQGVDSTGKSLKSNQVRDKEALLDSEYGRLGSILAPWSFSLDQAKVEAQNLQNAMTKAYNGNYQELINYFKKGHYQYNLWAREGNQLGEIYKTDIQSMFGVDISSPEWIGQLEELWEAAGQVDIQQATESLKIGRQYLPEPVDDSQTSVDPLLKEYGFYGED